VSTLEDTRQFLVVVNWNCEFYDFIPFGLNF